MRVLWVVSTIFPYPAEQLNQTKTCFGGWLNSLHSELIKISDVNIAIATTYFGEDFMEYDDGKTLYYLIPDKTPLKYNKKLEKYFKKICNDFKPDIIHIQGTEYPRSLAVINACSHIKIVTSIQGLITNYERVFYANLPFMTIIKNITLRDILKINTGILAHHSMLKRVKCEKEIIKKSNAIIGRTTWDYASCKAIDNDLSYYLCNENLRDVFYRKKWNINTIEENTIFFSNAQSIAKGFYILLEALKILKIDYPNIKVKVAGNNLLELKTLKQKMKIQSYTKYLIKLVNKYGLNDNIEFLGYLNEEEMANKLVKANVYVQSSSIENSSNSLGEAMLLGVPCVASNVGGTSDMIIDKKEGFLYPYTEPELLAIYIRSYFEDKNLCLLHSNAAKEHAMKTHNRKTNMEKTLEIYKKIMNDGE